MNKYKDADIIVILKGGLGNRLHTLYSCNYLTLKYGIIFKYFWSDDGCFESKLRFDNLFDFNNFEIIYNLSNYLYENRIILSTDDSLTKQNINKKIIWESPYLAQFENIIPSDKNISQSFKNINIRKNILNKIKSVVIPEDTIGIHIRGGDIKENKQAIEDNRRYIHPDKFIIKIKNFLKENINQNFFLSCENKEDEDYIYSKISNFNLIKLCPQIYNRNTVDGCIDGFINIVLLSNCKLILGMNSSFSVLASRIGQKNIIVLN